MRINAFRLVKLSGAIGSTDQPSLVGSTLSQLSLPLLSHLRNTIAIDYYYENASSVWLFWSDINKDQIFKGRLNQGVLMEIKPIVTYGIWTAEGLAVDWLGKNLYWVDSLLDQIQVGFFGEVKIFEVQKNKYKHLGSKL